MRYLSVCSGIEAASVAWHPLGWQPAAFAEIEPFPSAVLAYRFPEVPNMGDMTKFKEWGIEPGTINLMVGGTPCQSFSVAGLRKGLSDPRGNLMLTYGAIADYFKPSWIVWENVPGVLSSNRGRDFGTFLGMLGLIGYGFAYRVLDAQYYGVAQRRRRVFVVGHLGDWRPAAAVLFESEGLRWDSPPSRETRKRFAADVTPSLTASDRGIEQTGESIGQDQVGLVNTHRMTAFGEYQDDGTASTLKQRDYKDATDLISYSHEVAHTLRGRGFNASEDGTGRGTPIVTVCFESRVARNGRGAPSDIVPPLKASSGETGKGDAAPLIAFPANLSATQHASTENLSPALGAKNPTAVAFDGYNQTTSDTVQTIRADKSDGDHVGMVLQSAVRRLTPKECERLQGFPDDWTLIPWKGKPAPDGPRYKACGNSMAVPVMRWIGRRIEIIEAMMAGGVK